ncbi:phasin family protein [uncultured Clostridium sp.]|uniref:phasin family protein n=1 Tax=uncultured Clostridium sp. TaxID=59620 RepID=UPI0025FD25C9|nr:phasin family protein [uncultured Clostridium sp.]
MAKLGEDLKKILLAGIGAVALTAEKSKELVDEFVKKGELTVQQGKVLNEELKRNINNINNKKSNNENDAKDANNVNDVKEYKNIDIVEAINKLSKEEIATLKAKLEEIENEK